MVFQLYQQVAKIKENGVINDKMIDQDEQINNQTIKHTPG